MLFRSPFILIGWALGWTSSSMALLMPLTLGVTEWNSRWAPRAQTLEGFERRLIGCALLATAWGMVAQYELGAATWLAPLPYMITLSSYATVLPRRKLVIVAGFVASAMAGEVLGVRLGWLSGGGMAFTPGWELVVGGLIGIDRKSTRLNSSHT